MAKYEDDDDLDLEPDMDAGDEDADEEQPKPKKAKAKVVAADDEDEAPRPKKKVAAKAVADDDEAEEKRVVSKKPKSNKVEGKKTKMATKTAVKEKAHRSPKRADKPYGDESLIGTVFNLALRAEGVPVKKVKTMAEKNKKGKTPAYWVLTDIRRGAWKTAAGVWRWDRTEENGVLKVSNVRLKRPKAA